MHRYTKLHNVFISVTIGKIENYRQQQVKQKKITRLFYVLSISLIYVNEMQIPLSLLQTKTAAGLSFCQ